MQTARLVCNHTEGLREQFGWLQLRERRLADDGKAENLRVRQRDKSGGGQGNAVGYAGFSIVQTPGPFVFYQEQRQRRAANKEYHEREHTTQDRNEKGVLKECIQAEP